MNEQENKEEQSVVLSGTEIEPTEENLASVFEVVKTLKNLNEFGVEISLESPKLGRPRAIDKDVLTALSQAWLVGCNDEEACTFAGIYPATLYRFQKERPEFLEYKEHLKRNPILKARFTLYKALDDPNYAWKFLQKKTTDLQDDPAKGGGSVNLNIQLNQLVEQDRKRS